MGKRPIGGKPLSRCIVPRLGWDFPISRERPLSGGNRWKGERKSAAGSLAVTAFFGGRLDGSRRLVGCNPPKSRKEEGRGAEKESQGGKVKLGDEHLKTGQKELPVLQGQNGGEGSGAKERSGRQRQGITDVGGMDRSRKSWRGARPQ